MRFWHHPGKVNTTNLCLLEHDAESKAWAGLWACLCEHELHAGPPVSMAVGGHLVQAHLGRRSLLLCSDEAALSHEELGFYSPCVRASGAQRRLPACHVRYQALRRGQRLLVL